jgi:hypothetical protein
MPDEFYGLGANLGYLKFTRQSTWNPFWSDLALESNSVTAGDASVDHLHAVCIALALN